MRYNTIRFLTILFMFSAAAGRGMAQSDETPAYGNELSFHLGNYLPNQIPNVTEILPFWGARFGFSFPDGAVEIGGMNSHAKGVDFTMASISLRGDITLIENFTTMFYGGLDFNSVIPLGATTRHMTGGGHFGSGLMFLVNQRLWFRTDMRFNVNPGVGLYIGFGLVLRGKPDNQ